jgi:hypothetical protein
MKETTITLPKYRNRKGEMAGALEIKNIEKKNGSVIVTSTDLDYGSFTLSIEFMDRHTFEVGGMFVMKEGEDISYSTKEKFHKKYKLIT